MYVHRKIQKCGSPGRFTAQSELSRLRLESILTETEMVDTVPWWRVVACERANQAGHPMLYALVFSLLGLGWVILAAETRGFAWLLLWPGIGNLAIAAAYAGLGAKVFGKRPSGTIGPPALAILFPYTVFTWLTWFVIRQFTSEPACTEVAPGLWIGRRCGGNELPAGTSMIVDLTCELWEPASVRTRSGYRCLPVLDASICNGPDFRKLVDAVNDFPGVILIHCAQGHGRSACVAAGVLIARGIVKDATEAENRVVAVRPRVRLKPVQRRILASIPTAASRVG